VFAKLQGRLGRAAPRTRDALWVFVGEPFRQPADRSAIPLKLALL